MLGIGTLDTGISLQASTTRATVCGYPVLGDKQCQLCHLEGSSLACAPRGGRTQLLLVPRVASSAV